MTVLSQTLKKMSNPRGESYRNRASSIVDFSTFPIAELETRLNRLENILKESESPPISPRGKQNSLYENGLVHEVNQINAKMHKMQNEMEDVGEFMSKYQQIQPFLNSKEHLFLHSATKQILIVDNEEYIKEAAQSFESIANNEKFINSDNIQNVATLSKKLAPLELAHWNQKDELGILSTQLDSMLENYNTLIQLLSEKFTFWDTALTLWEQKVAEKKS